SFTTKLTARSGIRITLMTGLLAIAAATASSKLAVPWAVRWLAFLLGCPVIPGVAEVGAGAGGPAAAVPVPARTGPVFALTGQRGRAVPVSIDQCGGRSPAMVIVTRRRSAAADDRLPAAVRACRQYLASSPGAASSRSSPAPAPSAMRS